MRGDVERFSRPLRPLRWIASSRRDFGEFPTPVQESFGFELFLAQGGQHPPSAKPLKGFGSGVVELVDDFDGDAYRAVYNRSLRVRRLCFARLQEEIEERDSDAEDRIGHDRAAA